MSAAWGEVLVVGGSLGGVAAALRAAAMGARVHLLAETDWVGGQLTEQGVCTPDENEWIETVGSTAAYRDLRERIRTRYRSAEHSPSAAAMEAALFNAGNCWVNNGFSVEPLLARQLLLEMLAGYPNLTLHLGQSIDRVAVDHDQVTAVVAHGPGGETTTFAARLVLDATDLGELLPLAGADYRLGAESWAETGEPDAPPSPHREWVQPFTYPIAVERWPAGEGRPIRKPERYEELKEQQNYRLEDGAIRTMFSGDPPFWTYRRVIDATNFAGPPHERDLATINVDANDFLGDPYPTGDRRRDEETLYLGRLVSQGFLYWLQTECPRDDDPSRRGYPELQPARRAFGTEDGIAPQPYLREGRRLVALTTVLQQHVDAGFNPGPRATLFTDTCGIGHYSLDVHQGGKNRMPFVHADTKPFQIPLGALIPVRTRNLLAAGKNLGTTHITNGCYRLHPIEWAVGEAAGALAAFCVRRGATPRAVHRDRLLLLAYQRQLLAAGIPLFWWDDVPASHPAYAAIQLLGAQHIFTGGDDLSFRPDDLLGDGEADILNDRLPGLKPRLAPTLTRAEAAFAIAGQVERWVAGIPGGERPSRP